MFDNLGTALVQALGFFAVFGFFVYQTLFADSKAKNSKSNPEKTKISNKKESIFSRHLAAFSDEKNNSGLESNGFQFCQI